jgi:tetratricopeptide (TPR) repeat protein
MKSTQMALPRHIGRRRLSFVARAIVGLISLALASLFFCGQGLEANAASSNLTEEINAKLAALNVEPHAVELTSEKAIRVRHAIKQEDYSTADKIVASVLASSRVEHWRFYPFADFINDVVDLNDPAFEALLDAWVTRNKNDAAPLLVRAKYYHDIGWLKRGHNFAQKTPTANLEEFQRWMRPALADVEAAIRLDDSNPYGFLLKLRILRGSGISDRVTSAFDAAIFKYPGYYPLYEAMLSMLQPKWGGDVSAMYAFVERYAGQADENSPLKLLYLTLYRDLLETASTPCGHYWPDNDKMTQCTASGMQAAMTQGLERNVVRALQLYDRTDKYQFSIALQVILSDMLQMSGGEHYAGAVLELAADGMHSDTQLKQEKPGNNNYVIDKTVAESWYVKGFYDNALQKDRQALRDIEAMSFPSEEEKSLAIAGVYQKMGDTYSKLNQHADMIAYEEAAVALGNKTEQEYYICYGYYQLKDYDNAIRTCTRTIDHATNVLSAHYWRGVAYRDRGDADSALRDLTVVAESQSNFRSSAAIDMSMIHFGRNNNKSALDVLNRYKYLYDPEAAGRQNTAVSYNNRCYAYMQLGELNEALDDCTASLKYGAIPDALRKQQELIKRLNVNEKAL